MSFFEFNHPFFRPLWIRVLTVGVAAGWGILEFLGDAPFWGVIFFGLAGLAFYGLFIRFDPIRFPNDAGRRK